MPTIREMKEARAAKHAKAVEILNKKPLTAEDRQQFDRIMAEVEQDGQDIDRQQRAEATDAELRETRRPPEAQPGAGARDATTLDNTAARRLQRRYVESGESTLSVSERQSIATFIERDKRHRVAFRDYLVNGLTDMSAESRQALQEFRDMGVGTGNLGGYFVPPGFVYDVEQALKYYGNMLGVSTILDTATGQPLPHPTDNDTTVTGELVGEGSQVTTADVSIGHIIFGAFKFSTKMVKVSLELLQDSAFDIESYLQQKFAIRLGRILNTKFTLGAGTTEPTGIVTAAVANDGSPALASAGVAVGTPLIAAGSAANTGGSETGAASIGSSDLFNLEHTVDPLYRRGAKYMMHDSTLRAIKTLLDKYGRPLWVPGLATDAPDTINGYEYSINNDMAAIAASAVTILFGPLDKYLIRRVKELAVLRLVERFADYGQVAFLGFARYDGNLLDAGTHPISYLIQHS